MASPNQIISWGGGSSSLALRLVLGTIPEREARTLPLKRRTPITPPIALEMIPTIATAIAATVIPTLIRPFFSTVISTDIITEFITTLIIPTPLQAL